MNNARKQTTILFTSLVLSLIISFTGMNYAEASHIDMTIDNTKYDEGDTITITSQIYSQSPIEAHFDIYDPSNVLVYSGIETQIYGEYNYDHTLIAGNNTLGIEWISGNYILNEWYYDYLGSNETTTFQYTVDTDSASVISSGLATGSINSTSAVISTETISSISSVSSELTKEDIGMNQFEYYGILTGTITGNVTNASIQILDNGIIGNSTKVPVMSNGTFTYTYQHDIISQDITITSHHVVFLLGCNTCSAGTILGGDVYDDIAYLP